MQIFDTVRCGLNHTSMNQDRLTEWIESEKKKGLSYNKIGRALGVTGQAVILWRDQKTKKLDTQYLAAIAKYRGETIESTCEWLEVEPPQDAGQAGRIEQLEQEVAKLKEAFGELSEKLAMGVLNPSTIAILLKDALYQGHVDLRRREDQEQFLKLISGVLQDNLLARQILLKILGASPITRRDYPALAESMAAILGQKWTVFHVMNLVDTQPKDPNAP